MTLKRRRFLATTFLVFLLGLLALPASAKSPAPLPEASSALADYVKRPDASYAWQVRQRGKHGGGEYAELILTSQKWRDILWRHQLFVYRPAKVKDTKQALLLIDGG